MTYENILGYLLFLHTFPNVPKLRSQIFCVCLLAFKHCKKRKKKMMPDMITVAL